MKQPVKPKTGGFQAMGLSQELFRGVRDAWWFASDLHLHFALLAVCETGIPLLILCFALGGDYLSRGGVHCVEIYCLELP